MQIKAEKNIKLLDLLSFLSGFRTYEGVLAVYYAEITGSYTLALTMFAIFHVSSSFFEVPTGLLSNAIGRKKTIVIYHLTNAIAILTLYLAESTEALYISSVLIGLGLALASGTVSAFLYENLETAGRIGEYKRHEGRRKAYGRYSLVAAGLLGTGIIYFYDIKTAIFISILFQLICTVLSFYIVDLKKFEPNKSNIFFNMKQAWLNFMSDVALRDISLGVILARGLGNIEYRFRSLFFTLIMPDWIINMLGVLNNLVTAISMNTAHVVEKKFGIMKSLVHINIVERILTVGFVLLNSMLGGTLMQITTSFSFGLREIAASDLLQKRYSSDQRATMGSLVGLGGSLVYAVAAILIGMLADKIGLMNTMLALQPILLTSSYFFYKGIKLGQSQTK